MLTNVKCQVSVMKGCGNEMKFCSKREAERENKIFMYFTKLSSFLEKTLVHTTKQNKAILCCCCCIKCSFSLSFCFFFHFVHFTLSVSFLSLQILFRALNYTHGDNFECMPFSSMSYNGTKLKSLLIYDESKK